MNTLLLMFQSALQSWGVSNKHDIRETNDFPTKSGALGAVCAAMGIDRAEDISHLTAIAVNIMVLKSGTKIEDYQIAGSGGGVLSIEGKNKGLKVLRKYYLSDAQFLVALEYEDLELLRQIEAAFKHPKWFVSLGRKACVPSTPVYLEKNQGLKEGMGTEEAFKDYLMYIGDDSTKQTIVESPQGSFYLNDVPVGTFKNRKFGVRRLQRSEVCV